MKVLAYVALHYGKEYLEYSIRSIDHAVDEILITYTSTPTYGHATTLQNPDTYHDLSQIAAKFKKVNWLTVPSGTTGEGNHRQLSIDYARRNNYDIVLVVDADEVWNPLTVETAIKQAYEGKRKRYGVNHQGWYHFWRSFNEVCRDGFEPIRLINLNATDYEQGRVDGTIYHFGYANCEKLQEYKMAIHGHKGEIKPSWYTQKWLNYKKGETTHLHPASNDIWVETQPFDKSNLPDFMKEHPYYNLDKIV